MHRHKRSKTFLDGAAADGKTNRSRVKMGSREEAQNFRMLKPKNHSIIDPRSSKVSAFSHNKTTFFFFLLFDSMTRLLLLSCCSIMPPFTSQLSPVPMFHQFHYPLGSLKLK
jgi:hypothetical protein